MGLGVDVLLGQKPACDVGFGDVTLALAALKAGEAGAAAPQTFQLVLCIWREPLSPRNTVNPHLTQQRKAPFDLPNSYWAVDVLYHHNTVYFVYSVRGTFVRLNSAVHLQ